MHVQRFHAGYAVRLDAGEELIASLAELMREQDIGAGAVNGLGAVGSARLGCWLVGEQRYVDRVVTGDLEVVGLTGTLSWYDDEPFPHIHLMLTNADFEATGGHCFEARVSATLELFVRDWGVRVDRHMDPGIGLHLMELG